MEIKIDNHEHYDETALHYTLRLTPQERTIMKEALHDYLQYLKTQKEKLETFMPTDSVDEAKRIAGIAFYAEKIKIIEEMQKAGC